MTLKLKFFGLFFFLSDYIIQIIPNDQDIRNSECKGKIRKTENYRLL